MLAAFAQAKINTDSPFAPRGGAAMPSGPAAENTPIEFRGVMTTATGLRFAIYEPARQKGDWVALNEAGHDYVVRSYDGPQSSVKLDYQGRVQTLTLKEAKFDGSAPVASAVPQISAPSPMRPPGGPQVAQAGAPADPKAMEAVATEIRRRRTARAQATQGQPSNGTPTTATPQPVPAN